jgi:pyrimidine operon attenuation protein / uracil phosphoribosyltransferase
VHGSSREPFDIVCQNDVRSKRRTCKGSIDRAAWPSLLRGGGNIEMPQVILDESAIREALDRMAETLCRRSGDGPFAVVGVRRGGEFLARRLGELLSKRTGQAVPMGVVDITLYRDDGFGPHEWPTVGVTKIPFELKSYTVVLVDDVLYTGRTTRAALDAILDYGRPRAVRLAVLVDRGLRELPIAAEAVGVALDTKRDQHVDVQLTESGAERDAVIVTQALTHKATS